MNGNLLPKCMEIFKSGDKKEKKEKKDGKKVDLVLFYPVYVSDRFLFDVRALADLFGRRLETGSLENFLSLSPLGIVDGTGKVKCQDEKLFRFQKSTNQKNIFLRITFLFLYSFPLNL